MFADYDHFLAIAARSQWDEAAIDLAADARAWPEVADARLTELVAGFCVGEAGVAEHLASFAVGPAAECFAAQQRDEERHARFFARYAAAVGLDDPRAHVSDEFLELFEVRLPEAVAGAPGEAVGLYHMVLEGVVFIAGQLALLDLARRPAARACARASSWSCATSAGTSASAPAASPISTTTRPRSSRRASAPRRCGRPSTQSGWSTGCAAGCARCGGSARCV